MYYETNWLPDKFSYIFPLLSANLDFDAKFDLFFDETMRLYKKCCEIKTKEISLNNVKKPWISRDIIRKIRLKHLLFKRFKNREILYEQFDTYQKELKITNTWCYAQWMLHKRIIWIILEKTIGTTASGNDCRLFGRSWRNIAR